MNVDAVERQVLIDLRVELGRRVRACIGCGGAGRLPRSGHRCPLCRSAQAALEASGALLLPARGSVDRLLR